MLCGSLSNTLAVLCTQHRCSPLIERVIPPGGVGAARQRSSGFSKSGALIRCGAPKIRALLKDEQPETKPPVASTIGEILRCEGLTRPGKKRRRTPPYEGPLAHAGAPNEVLSIDFKGWFRARNGERIDPLTLIDNYSRYVLCCQALEGCDFAHVQAVMATVFLEYGLPRRIRSDNGAPFAFRKVPPLFPPRAASVSRAASF